MIATIKATNRAIAAITVGAIAATVAKVDAAAIAPTRAALRGVQGLPATRAVNA